MRLSGSHTYPVPVEAVITMLRDRAATIAKYESMGHRDVEIVDFASDDTALRIVSSRVVDVELPGFAKKALKPTNTMVQTDEWRRRDDGSWAGTFDVEVHGSPAHISGTMTLGPDGAGSRHDVTLDVDVKIPLVGGKIADWVGKNDVRRTLDAEYAFNDSRLCACLIVRRHDGPCRAGEQSVSSSDPALGLVSDSPAMVEIKIFRNVPDTMALQAGDVLFREGEPGDVMYAVVEGQLDLTLDGTVVEEVGPGGILGEMALIDSAARSATATARVPATVAPVDRKYFVFLVQEHPTFALQVMAVLAERLRRANEHA